MLFSSQLGLPLQLRVSLQLKVCSRPGREVNRSWQDLTVTSTVSMWELLSECSIAFQTFAEVVEVEKEGLWSRSLRAPGKFGIAQKVQVLVVLWLSIHY